jgi:hypothetical protein
MVVNLTRGYLYVTRKTYVASSVDETCGPRTWKRIFAHDTDPVFGIWYWVGASYASRREGLNSQTYVHCQFITCFVP